MHDIKVAGYVARHGAAGYYKLRAFADVGKRDGLTATMSLKFGDSDGTGDSIKMYCSNKPAHQILDFYAGVGSNWGYQCIDKDTFYRSLSEMKDVAPIWQSSATDTILLGSRLMLQWCDRHRYSPFDDEVSFVPDPKMCCYFYMPPKFDAKGHGCARIVWRTQFSSYGYSDGSGGVVSQDGWAVFALKITLHQPDAREPGYKGYGRSVKIWHGAQTDPHRFYRTPEADAVLRTYRHSDLDRTVGIIEDEHAAIQEFSDNIIERITPRKGSIPGETAWTSLERYESSISIEDASYFYAAHSQWHMFLGTLSHTITRHS